MSQQLRNLAEFWLGHGARVLPLKANKAPVSHLVPRGFHDASNRPDDLWWFEHEDTELVGIVPGSMGLLVLDVDVKGGKQGPANLKALEAQHSDIPVAGQVATASGGVHLYLRKPVIHSLGHVGNAVFCGDVDVRSDGGYVVAPGNDGYGKVAPHFEVTQVPLAPAWVVERVRSIQAEAQVRVDQGYQVEKQGEVAIEDWAPKVREVFDSFARMVSDRHGTMLAVVNALASYELLGYIGATTAIEHLREKFVKAVSDRSSETEARLEYRRALEGARRRVATNESTVLVAREADAAFIEAIKAAGATKETVATIEALEEDEAPPRLRFWSARELADMNFKMEWMIRNVLCTPTYGQIAGESKTLKTYISQYLGLAVATGKDFLGQFPIDKVGPVVYFVGEGGIAGWTRRMPRIAASVGIDNWGDAPLHASFVPVPFLSPMFRNSVEHVLETFDPVLTIIDPLYAFHGGDVEASNLHQEGALLTGVAEPFIEHGSNMLILNHWNKQAGGRSLKRITMAGSGEWVDSWFMTEPNGDPSVNTGDFPITVEFGSRQWGGAKWNIDFNIGGQNAMGGESDDPITFDVHPSNA